MTLLPAVPVGIGYASHAEKSNHPAAPGHRVGFERMPSPPGSNRSRWSVLVHKERLLVRWTCTPFHHVDDASHLNDATMTVRVRETQGTVLAKPRFAQDTTDFAHDRDRALIAIGMQGSGRVVADLELSLDTRAAAAGVHCTTVEVTVTAP